MKTGAVGRLEEEARRTMVFFEEGAVEQIGSVEICDTGWGQKEVTPEECEQRIEKLETDVEG